MRRRMHVHVWLRLIHGSERISDEMSNVPPTVQQKVMDKEAGTVRAEEAQRSEAVGS
jgi:hypothetical protein